MKKRLRKECNKQGIALLIYKAIMTEAVTMVIVLGMIGIMVEQILAGQQDMEVILNTMLESITALSSSGWGYLLAIAVGTVVLLLWKKPRFFRREIMRQGRPMGFGSFALILSLFMSAQLLSQIGIIIMNIMLSILGIDLMGYMEMAASIDTDNFSMWLYAGLGAPIFEELLFRGLVMRSLEPYGKKIAILVSALLFGFYHGNPLQAPFAAMVGLVLGYVAMEHNIVWAMVLHMFNNLIFADCLPRLLGSMPEILSTLIIYAVLFAFAIAAAVLLIVKRRQLVAHLKKDPIMPWQFNGAFLSPLLLVLVGSCVGDMLLFMLMVAIA